MAQAVSVMNDPRVRARIMEHVQDWTREGPQPRKVLVDQAMTAFGLESSFDRKQLENLFREEVRAGTLKRSGGGASTKYEHSRKNGTPPSSVWQLKPEGTIEAPEVPQVVTETPEPSPETQGEESEASGDSEALGDDMEELKEEALQFRHFQKLQKRMGEHVDIQRDLKERTKRNNSAIKSLIEELGELGDGSWLEQHKSQPQLPFE